MQWFHCYLVAAFVSALGVMPPPAAAAPPNVLVFLVDDLGYSDVGCYGSTFYETPHVDRLAATGMRFTDGYAACPVCSPTRAAMLSGKYPVRLNLTNWIHPGRGNQPENWRRNTRLLPAPYVDHLPMAEVTLAEAFRASGYATFFAGKWHLGNEGQWPEDQGFDVNRGGVEWGNPRGPGRYFSPYGNSRLADGRKGEHLTERLGRETAQFIAAHHDQPFFAYLSFYTVHTPLMSPIEYQNKYEAKAAGIEVKWGREHNNRVRQTQSHAIYAGMVETMDRAVGVVLDQLEELSLAENTIVVFTSDNGGLSTTAGWPTSNLPLRAGKGWLYEGGIRVPWIVRYPPVTKPGRVSSEPIISNDLYPTLLELAGLPARPEQHLDGVSLAPVLEGGALAERALFWHYPHYGNQGGSPGAAVRAGKWKLIHFYEDDSMELYDLENDLGETVNVAEKHLERVTELREKLDRWRAEVDARLPTANPNYVAAEELLESNCLNGLRTRRRSKGAGAA